MFLYWVFYLPCESQGRWLIRAVYKGNLEVGKAIQMNKIEEIGNR
jgi:hypothetical protein